MALLANMPSNKITMILPCKYLLMPKSFYYFPKETAMEANTATRKGEIDRGK